jgi:hypothetical protein
MKFSIEKSIALLERTPKALETLLKDLPEDWTNNNEGGESWSPYDVIGHFIHGETTDWIQRLEIILSNKEDRSFQPFDRFAQFEESKGKSLTQLLVEFKTVREKNITILKSKNLTEKDLDKTGVHPKFGTVSLRQLLSTWTVHDMAHLAQIARVMAKQYAEEVGPWKEYLPILAPKHENA